MLELIPQPTRPICWAACLGNCSSDASREHILSRSTIPGPEIFIHGFPFLCGQSIVLHKNHFTSNILCRYHNNKLSSVDQAGTAAFEALKDAASNNPRQKNKIRGTLFERWLLKTVINIEVVSDFNIKVPTDLVEIAFGKRTFVNRSGLFYFDARGQTVFPEERITYTRLLDPARRNAIRAGRFTFYGFHLLLALGDTKGIKTIQLEAKDGTTTACNLMHHPTQFKFHHKSNVIVIDWQK